MSETDNKKHRHDVGHPDHGAVQTETVTRTLQGLMGLFLVLAALLTIYAVLVAGFGVSAP